MSLMGDESLDEANSRIAALDAALMVQRQVWQSIRDRVQSARDARDPEKRGGQHCGVPEFISWSLSALLCMDREARFAIEAIDAARDAGGAG